MSIHLETRVLVTGNAGFLGSRSRIVHRPLPQDDPRQRWPDITQAQRLLGWKPHTALQAGLKRTIGYFDALLGDPTVRPVLQQQSGIDA